MHGTTDMIDQIALAAAVELLQDMDVDGVQILSEDDEPVDKSINQGGACMEDDFTVVTTQDIIELRDLITGYKGAHPYSL